MWVLHFFNSWAKIYGKYLYDIYMANGTFKILLLIIVGENRIV